MAAQTWDLAYYATIIVATGTGNTDSTAGDSAGVHYDWPIAYVSTTVSATGSGNTDSTAVGTVGTPTFWPITYWDGTNNSTGVGNTTSTGVGSVTAFSTTWYDITGTVSDGATGVGDTTSSGVDSGVTVVGGPPSVAGFGNTTSTGVGIAGVWIDHATATRPFGVRLDTQYVSVALDVVPVTAPLDMTTEV